MNNMFVINRLRHNKSCKCECCDTVRDIYVKLLIKDKEDLNNKTIMGDLDLCKDCAKNLIAILNLDFDIERKTEIKKFEFDGFDL